MISVRDQTWSIIRDILLPGNCVKPHNKII